MQSLEQACPEHQVGKSLTAPGQDPAAATPSRGDPRTEGHGSWWEQKGPVVKFVGGATLLAAAYYAVTLTAFFKRAFLPAYLHLTAEIANALLHALGLPTTVSGRVISSDRFAIEIARGCDGLDPAALFLAAVLAFPARWSRKTTGVLLGVPFLLLMNLVRVVSLFLVGAYWPNLFELMHIDVWQVLFILLAILCWVLWLRWGVHERQSTSYACD
jgi:exosortase H (IPTLxxWG-CTERM-specific)